jgi:hypothetical protein
LFPVIESTAATCSGEGSVLAEWDVPRITAVREVYSLLCGAAKEENEGSSVWQIFILTIVLSLADCSFAYSQE